MKSSTICTSNIESMPRNATIESVRANSILTQMMNSNSRTSCLNLSTPDPTTLMATQMRKQKGKRWFNRWWSRSTIRSLFILEMRMSKLWAPLRSPKETSVWAMTPMKMHFSLLKTWSKWARPKKSQTLWMSWCERIEGVTMGVWQLVTIKLTRSRKVQSPNSTPICRWQARVSTMRLS